MKVLNLCCAAQHRFEGWFGSEADYLAQVEKKLIACPLCGDTQVQRLPSAPHVISSASRSTTGARDSARAAQGSSSHEPSGLVGSGPGMPSDSQAASPPQVDQHDLQAAWIQAVQHVIKHTDDVGPHFAEEARRMHYGEIRERPIRGQATPVEALSLREEGIEVAALPLPAAMKGPLQ